MMYFINSSFLSFVYFFVNLFYVMINPKFSLGWIPDLPDHRDFTQQSEELKREMNQIGLGETTQNIPSQVDLRNWWLTSRKSDTFKFMYCSCWN